MALGRLKAKAEPARQDNAKRRLTADLGAEEEGFVMGGFQSKEDGLIEPLSPPHRNGCQPNRPYKRQRMV
jgi:hypothetical protein